MKVINTIILSTALLISLSACNSKKSETLDTDLVNNPISAEGKADADLPDMTFDNKKYDFGIMKQGEIKSTEFKFKNTGKADLIIEDAKGSCGCTVPVYPKEPIKPGAEAVIKVTFNSDGKNGIQNKTVTMITNCIPSTKFLEIKANVIK
jgi:hypothetical protein